MKNFWKIILYTIGGILIFWTAMTFWVQYFGTQQVVTVGDASAPKKALIVYNPDPIYDLDAQVCRDFAEGLNQHGFSVKIATAQLAQEEPTDYELYVFCANTYNWAPDWQIKNFITEHPNLEDELVVAITLGSGDTNRSQRKLEETIQSKNAILLDSRSYWLLKPNDESRMEERNTEVAKDLVHKWGESIGKKLVS